MNAETNLTGSNKFPVKLYNILQEAETSPYLADIVSWMPDGNSFKVHKKDDFSKVVLPTTFGTNVYKSYQRNLHFWGFQNIRKGSEKGICSHPHFVKGRPELLCKMHRVRAPGKLGHDSTPHDDDRATSHGSSVHQTSQGGQIPPFVFAGAPFPGRTVSPSLASNTSSATSQNLSGLLETTNNPTALLLLLRQQQEQLIQQQLIQQRQFKSQPQQLAESLIFQHLIAQQKQQQQQEQQQRHIQELLAGTLGQANATQNSQSSNTTLDQGALVQTLLAQLLQQQTPSTNVNDANAALLAGLLR